MIGANAAMLVVLGLAATRQPPDLQVEANTATGVDLPELTEAISRALVVGGAHVVLRGPTSEPCEYCAKIMVTEISPGVCQVEMRHEQRRASTTLHLPVTSSLFDRARAIAIQARLLVPWQSAPESKSKDLEARKERRPAAREQHDQVVRAQGSPSATVRDSAPIALPPMASPIPERQTPSASDVVPNDPKPIRPSENKPQAHAALTPPREEAGESPVALLGTAHGGGHEPPWPWIPTALGAGAAAAAGVCAVVARGHYNALSDRNQSYDSAQAHKSAGENWQTGGWILAGVAAVGLTTGIVGFSRRSSVTTVASPIPGGGAVAVAGNFP